MTSYGRDIVRWAQKKVSASPKKVEISAQNRNDTGGGTGGKEVNDPRMEMKSQRTASPLL